LPVSLVVRGITPGGDAAETFTATASEATWKSQVDEGHRATTSPALYIAEGGTMAGGTDLLLHSLLSAKDRTLPLLPNGQARAEKLTETTVGEGPRRTKVEAWSVYGLGPSPQ